MAQPMICFPVGGGGHPDQGLPGGGPGGRPDNSLPSLPAYPDHGLPGGGVIDPIPGHPIVLPPAPPVAPDNTLPPVVWPGVPAHPATPTHPIALPPGMVWPPLPPAAGSEKLLVIVIIPGIGAKWVVIDPTLRPEQLPGYTPQPK